MCLVNFISEKNKKIWENLISEIALKSKSNDHSTGGRFRK